MEFFFFIFTWSQVRGRPHEPLLQRAGSPRRGERRAHRDHLGRQRPGRYTIARGLPIRQLMVCVRVRVWVWLAAPPPRRHSICESAGADQPDTDTHSRQPQPEFRILGALNTITSGSLLYTTPNPEHRQRRRGAALVLQSAARRRVPLRQRAAQQGCEERRPRDHLRACASGHQVLLRYFVANTRPNTISRLLDPSETVRMFDQLFRRSESSV